MYSQTRVYEPCVRRQQLTEGGEVIKSQLFQRDFGKYEVELTYENMLMPRIPRGSMLTCLIEGKEREIECVYQTGMTMRTTGESTSRYSCNIKSHLDENAKIEGIWLFFLPYATFGLGDSCVCAKTSQMCFYQHSHIAFAVNNIEWELSYVYENDDFLTSSLEDFVQMYQHSPKKISHSVLSVSSRDICLAEAKMVAEDICWLLKLAMGNCIMWTEVYHLDGEEMKVVENRNCHLPELALGEPLSQQMDGRIKDFIESAYPIYLQKKEWWRLTLDWYAQHRLQSVFLQTKMMIVSMLFERCASPILADENFSQVFLKIFDLAPQGGESEENKKRVHEYMGLRCNDWDDKQSVDVLKWIMNKGKKLSYDTRIQMLFISRGLLPPSGGLLRQRNFLMHNGELSDMTATNDEHESYWIEMTNHITVLLLRMLEYTGNSQSINFTRL